MHGLLFEKYRASIDIYNVKQVNEIIFNRPVRITSIFKDYLVNDEVAEFLKREYKYEEIPQKMHRLIEFFNSYFKVFPNYICIPERNFMYKNIERKQRIIDEKQYIAAKNREAMKRKERKKARKGKLVNMPDDFIKVEDNSLDSDSELFTKLFTPSYYQNITQFRHNFSGRKMSSDNLVEEVISVEPKKTKVFNYLEKQQPKPVILSQNIMNYKAAKRKQSDEAQKENGWTKLFRFFSDESNSIKFTENKDVSLSISNAWKQEEPGMDIDLSASSSHKSEIESMRKFSQETQDDKDKSTNMATTLEGISAEKHRIPKESTQNLEHGFDKPEQPSDHRSSMQKVLSSKPLKQVKRIRILKNQKRIKIRSDELSFHGTNIKNTRNRNGIQNQRFDLSRSIHQGNF